MKIFKICTKKENQKTGKKSWPEIGVLFSNDKGQLSGYLNNNPDVQVYLFEQQPKQAGQQQNGAYQQPPKQPTQPPPQQDPNLNDPASWDMPGNDQDVPF